MTPKEQAKQLIDKLTSQRISVLHIDTDGDAAIADGQITMQSAKALALLFVEQIEVELAEYGQINQELQNMDWCWRFWQKVEDEIKKM